MRWGRWAAVVALVCLAACSDHEEDGRSELDPMTLTPGLVALEMRGHVEAAPGVVLTVTERSVPSYVETRSPGIVQVVDSSDAGDPEGTWVYDDETLCFDKAFRPRIFIAVSQSYGSAKFDPKPWSCAPRAFPMAKLLTVWREQQPTLSSMLIALGRDAEWGVRTREEVDGVDAVHVPVSGVDPWTDVWFDDELRLVRLSGVDVSWDVSYAGKPPTLPPVGERGAFGYAVGPGQAYAKSCIHAGERCDYRFEYAWSDGR